MRVKLLRTAPGPVPYEVVVSVHTAEGGQEEFILDARSIENDTIEVGMPAVREERRALVEFPRESMSGRWRNWVPASVLA